MVGRRSVLLGWLFSFHSADPFPLRSYAGSIPELASPSTSSSDEEEGKIYNTSPIFSRSGELVAKHRKVHLFDIDIPGGIRFQESETLTGGSKIGVVETGESRRRRELKGQFWLAQADGFVAASAEFGKLAIGICYDLRFPEMAQIAAREG